MNRLAIALASAGLLACASHVPFKQNLGVSHKVKRGMTPEQALAIMGTPFHTLSLDSVEEWRYCDTRDISDEYVVLYLQNNRVIDRAGYTFVRGEGDFHRIGDCESRTNLYTDRRSPPRRVRQIREQFRR
jgi:hypothetical protein